MKSKLLVVLLAFFIISGCSINHSKNSVAYVYAGSINNSNNSVAYVYTVTIKEKTYGFTDTEVPKEQIGEKIGDIPIDCSVSECAQPPGNIFYEIKGNQGEKYVAVFSEVEKKYYRWTNIN
ncbi:hypothetical protein [Paenibacillus glycanilyticus]|uniref:hypothetical protein n=1 Tax=Paenibacillus glycanilyticus TaxID=126569 RepID=UPI0019106EE1|nr:hypothetical protein [Paenibacillus glycanilyticus]